MRCSNAVEIFMSPTMEDQATPRPEQVSLLGLHDGDVNVFKFVTVTTGTKTTEFCINDQF